MSSRSDDHSWKGHAKGINLESGDAANENGVQMPITARDKLVRFVRMRCAVCGFGSNRASPFLRRIDLADDGYVFRFGLAGLAILADVEADLLAIRKSAATHGRDVNEYVRSTIVGGDEAEALILSEKFNGASGHDAILNALCSYGIAVEVQNGKATTDWIFLTDSDRSDRFEVSGGGE
jgi:hypothetical protein